MNALTVAMTGATIGSVLFGAGGVLAENFQKLNGSQIRAKFSGMEFTDEVHWGEVYETNGRLSSESMGTKRSGAWRVVKDRLCVDLEKGGGNDCYDVWTSGKKVQLRSADSNGLPLEGVLQSPPNRR